MATVAPFLRLLTVGEVARALRCSRASVYRHVRLGQLEALRVGDRGPLRFRPEDVEAVLQPAHPHTEGDAHP